MSGPPPGPSVSPPTSGSGRIQAPPDMWNVIQTSGAQAAWNGLSNPQKLAAIDLFNEPGNPLELDSAKLDAHLTAHPELVPGQQKAMQPVGGGKPPSASPSPPQGAAPAANQQKQVGAQPPAASKQNPPGKASPPPTSSGNGRRVHLPQASHLGLLRNKWTWVISVALVIVVIAWQSGFLGSVKGMVGWQAGPQVVPTPTAMAASAGKQQINDRARLSFPQAGDLAAYSCVAFMYELEGEGSQATLAVARPATLDSDCEEKSGEVYEFGELPVTRSGVLSVIGTDPNEPVVVKYEPTPGVGEALLDAGAPPLTDLSGETDVAVPTGGAVFEAVQTQAAAQPTP